MYVLRKLLTIHALYPLGPVATLWFCHLRPRCVSKQRRTTNVIVSDRVWWIWCDAGLATVATRPQRSPHSVASNSRPDYFAATRSRSLFLTINECCVSAAAAAIWEIQWRRSTPQLAPVDTGGVRKQWWLHPDVISIFQLCQFTKRMMLIWLPVYKLSFTHSFMQIHPFHNPYAMISDRPVKLHSFCQWSVYWKNYWWSISSQ